MESARFACARVLSSPEGSIRSRAARALAVLALSLAVAGCAGSHHRRPPANESNSVPIAHVEHRPSAAEGVYHVVRRGETLWRIAKTYGVPLAELAEVNGIADPTHVVAGSKLFVPGVTAAVEVPQPVDPSPEGTADGPFVWPVQNGRILSYYGASRRSHRHQGLDIGGRLGQPVIAAEAGRVVYTGATMQGYGKTVIIDHGNRLSSLYAHNSDLLVRKGQWVAQGQTIARVGHTGNASANHCHFEIRIGDIAIDPLRYLGPGDGRNR